MSLYQAAHCSSPVYCSLCQCIKARMKARSDGTITAETNTVDILITGCEVSLWVGEQFASDLQKCFPKLGIKAVSANKLLGLFGQELPMPAVGFPYTKKCLDMKDPIVMIVSHSGGTFGPLGAFCPFFCLPSTKSLSGPNLTCTSSQTHSLLQFDAELFIIHFRGYERMGYPSWQTAAL